MKQSVPPLDETKRRVLEIGVGDHLGQSEVEILAIKDHAASLRNLKTLVMVSHKPGENDAKPLNDQIDDHNPQSNSLKR